MYSIGSVRSVDSDYVLFSQEPEPLFKACVDKLVEDLHIQKFLEPHLSEKKWWPEMFERHRGREVSDGKLK